MTKEKRICPKCGKEYVGYPAISRDDNKTEICPNCGTREALDRFGMSEEEAIQYAIGLFHNGTIQQIKLIGKDGEEL